MKAFVVLTAIAGTVAAGRNGYAYMDDWTCTSSSCFVPYLKSVVTTGLNNVILAFAMPTGSTELASWYYDSTGAYYALSDSDRLDVKSHYEQHGANLWMSIGGGTYHASTYLAQDPATIASLACTRAKTHGYYGVDFDLEEVSTGNWNQFLPWAIKATQTCSAIIPHIAHAPQAPYLGAWLNYGYEKLIPYVERMLVQYYNQGRPYNSEASLWGANTDGNYDHWTDLLNRAPEYKDLAVIGKYMRPQDGGSGMVTAPEFDALLAVGETKYGYRNGYMIWKIPKADEVADLNNFINQAIPVLANGGNSGPNPPPPVVTSTTTTTTTSKNGGGGNPPPPPPPPPPPVVPTTTTRAPYTGGSIVAYCQRTIGHTIPDWAQWCRDLCAYYSTTGKLHCMEANTGDLLVDCVMRLHPGSCQYI